MLRHPRKIYWFNSWLLFGCCIFAVKRQNVVVWYFQTWAPIK